MDVLTLYAGTTAIWLSLQSITLLIFPRLILDLLSTATATATGPGGFSSHTALESYLARLLAVALLTLTIIALYFTYFPPPPPYSVTDDAAAPASSSSSAITHILTIFHTLSFIVIYTRYSTIVSLIPSTGNNVSIDYEPNTVGYILGATGYAICASLGVWVLVFGSSPSRVSKRTGADKRTSGWPFKNDKAYNKKKDRKLAVN